MTVGSKTYDLTVPYGNGRAGSRFTKTWTGGDAPKVKPSKGSKEPPRKIPGYVTSLVRGLPDGKWVRLGKDYELPRKPVRPPKRMRREEHDYDCTVSDQDFPWGCELFNSSTGQWVPLALDTGMTPAQQPGSSWGSNDEIALLGKLREKIVGSDFNLGVFLAEGRQSLGMVANAASRIYGAVNAAHKGNFVRAAHILTDGTERARLRKRRAAATNWLELQYGWLPLISDASEGAKALANILNVPLQQRYVARRKVPVLLTPSSPNMQYQGQYGYEAGQIIAFLKQKDTVLLTGLTDPASIVWEKIPYSFVADWFIPIGNYLAAHALARALTGTFVSTHTTLHVCNGLTPKGAWLGKVRGDTSTFRHVRCIVSRKVSTTLQVPLPSLKPLSQAAGWKHCANAVALLTSARTVSKLRSLWQHDARGVRDVLKGGLSGRLEYTE